MVELGRGEGRGEEGRERRQNDDVNREVHNTESILHQSEKRPCCAGVVHKTLHLFSKVLSKETKGLDKRYPRVCFVG